MNAVTEPNAPAFVWQVRVYWEDTDGGGVVYHACYLNFFERARTEWLRALGVHQAELKERENVVFVVRRMTVDWLLPARLDDLLDISVEAVQAGATRLEFRQRMRRAGELLAEAEVTAACLNAETFKPSRMPGWIRSEINHVK